MEDADPVSDPEARACFAGLEKTPALVLAVSGGPDSTALLFLMARWRRAMRRGPRLAAVTVDHGLRPESKREADQVKKLARALGVDHRTMRWTGRKPKTGLQAAAREARYRLLAAAARKAGASHVVTAHTLDDQAETVLLRMARGSGVAGLAAMAREAPLPGDGALTLVRPLLEIPKARLLATLRRAGLSFAEDASNRDPRFTRVRLRELMPRLAREGLTPQRLAKLARRLRRLETALEAAASDAKARLSLHEWAEGAPIEIDAAGFRGLPAEVALRLLGHAIAATGDEGSVELGKLEALYDALPRPDGSSSRFRRTLAGALITLSGKNLIVERAPPRRNLFTKPRSA
jgi:tRNA(Ile)-lysidine synthase